MRKRSRPMADYRQQIVLAVYKRYANDALVNHLNQLKFCTLDEAFDVIYRYQQRKNFAPGTAIPRGENENLSL